MTNVFDKMVNYYNETSYTHDYVFGFNYKGTVYACFGDATMLKDICKLDKASSKNGGGYSLRFQPNMRIREYLMRVCEVVDLCSYDDFKALYASNKYNWGENFELAMANKYNMDWHKDNVKYTDGPDMVINGKPVQLKYYKATMITENMVEA